MDNLNLLNTLFVGSSIDTADLEAENYLRFSAPTAFKIKLVNKFEADTTLFNFQYKRDRDVVWMTKAVTMLSASSSDWIDVDANEKIYFRNNNNTFSNYERAVGFLLSSAANDVSVSGNIKCLINGRTELVTTGADDYIFHGLFSGCVQLRDASKVTLPYPSTSPWCYQQLFADCTALTAIPNSLPSYTLDTGCYAQMYRGCTSLTAASFTFNAYASGPKQYCMYGMFSGCTKLTSTISLPTIGQNASYCYQDMFRNCTSLKTPPALPATTLANSCYSEMFYGCTSLTSAPALPATTLAQSCYGYMFSYCFSLSSAPQLPATTLASNCYASMFYGCTSLTSIPNLSGVTSLNTYCYDHMFYGCTGLTNIETKTFFKPANVTSIPNNAFYGMFQGCTNLANVNKYALGYLASQSGCAIGTNAFNAMFKSCTHLLYTPFIPFYIDINSTNASAFKEAFYGCTSLTMASPIYIKSKTTEGQGNFTSMFQNCSALSCLAIVTPLTAWPTGNAFTNWVNGVAAVGTFYKSSTLPATRGVSNIPSNWTISQESYDTLTGEVINSTFPYYSPSTSSNIVSRSIVKTSGTDTIATASYGCTVTGTGAYAGTGRSEIINMPVTVTKNGTKATDYAFSSIPTAATTQNLGSTWLQTTGGSGTTSTGNSIENFYEDRVSNPNDRYNANYYSLQQAIMLLTRAWNATAANANVITKIKTQRTTNTKTATNDNRYLGGTEVYTITGLNASGTAQGTATVTVKVEFPNIREADADQFCIYAVTKANAWNLLITNPRNVEFSYCTYQTSQLGEESKWQTTNNSNIKIQLSGGASTDYWVKIKNLSPWLNLNGNTNLVKFNVTGNTNVNISGQFNSLIGVPGRRGSTSQSLANERLQALFNGCTKLVSISSGTEVPIKLTSSHSLIPASFGKQMFKGCTALTGGGKWSANVATLNIGDYAFQEMFQGCTALKSWTSTLTVGASRTVGQYAFNGTYKGCTALTGSSFTLNTPGSVGTAAFMDMFNGCTALTNSSNGISLSLDINNAYSFKQMFYGCNNMTVAPNITNTTCTTAVGNYAFQNMFYNCKKIVDINIDRIINRPGKTLGTYCYDNMFTYCEQLSLGEYIVYGNNISEMISYLPKLKCQTMGTYSCNNMFASCGALKVAPLLVVKTTNNNCYQYMFTNCGNLKCIIDVTSDGNTSNNAYYYALESSDSYGTIYCGSTTISSNWSSNSHGNNWNYVVDTEQLNGLMSEAYYQTT